MDARIDGRRLDYEQTLETYRQLADIRFKLLAFVPTLSGAAVALLSKTKLGKSEETILAALGFLVTLGILLYDQRNTQFYNGAITRAQELEKGLLMERFKDDQNYGLFGSRRDHRRRYLIGLPVGHDLGLAFVYSAVLGAWAFAIVQANRPSAAWIAPAVGSLIATSVFAQLLWNNGKPEWLVYRWDCWQEPKREKRAQRRERKRTERKRKLDACRARRRAPSGTASQPEGTPQQDP